MNVLAVMVLFIAMRVEVLNYQAGTVMPRGPLDKGKWREDIVTNELMWKQARGPRDDEGNPLPRALTPAEVDRMNSDIAKSRANNQLREWIRSAGLLQYLLLPALIFSVGSIAACIRSKRHAINWSAAILIALFAGGSLLYRGYFSSLGW